MSRQHLCSALPRANKPRREISQACNGSTNHLQRRSSKSEVPIPVNIESPDGGPATQDKSTSGMMSSLQLFMFFMILTASLSSSFTACLFPPFYPKLAELKGSSATEYGVIIGINCLVAFLVTPFIGNNLGLLGVKFAFSIGLLGGGVCCALSGLLEFFPPGITFIVFSILLRVVQATSNAMVVTGSFTYTATIFPKSVGKIFSITRCVMNVAKLGGPMFGGLLYEYGGFVCPFVTFGVMQVLLALVSALTLPELDMKEDCDQDEREKGKVSILQIFSIPTIWFSFLAFITANFSPFYVGLLYGLRNGANSLASPLWGWISDRNKTSVKPLLVVSALLVSTSFFLMGASTTIGIHLELTVPLLVSYLCLNGVGISGQQVAGIVDALHEVSNAGYADSPSTQGLVAGLWSSLSGLGRFISRAGSGILVDYYGFNAVVTIACSLQGVLAMMTLLYLVVFECSLVKRDRRLELGDVMGVESAEETRTVMFVPSDPFLPSSALMASSLKSSFSVSFVASSFRERKPSIPKSIKRGRHWSVL